MYGVKCKKACVARFSLGRNCTVCLWLCCTVILHFICRVFVCAACRVRLFFIRAHAFSTRQNITYSMRALNSFFFLSSFYILQTIDDKTVDRKEFIQRSTCGGKLLSTPYNHIGCVFLSFYFYLWLLCYACTAHTQTPVPHKRTRTHSYILLAPQTTLLHNWYNFTLFEKLYN